MCRLQWSLADVTMHRYGTFDVISDAEDHVTGSQPIRKSLNQLRPERIFRRTVTQDAGGRRCRLGGPTCSSDVEESKLINQRHLAAATSNKLGITGYHQPQYAAAVSKSGGGGGDSQKPEVECQQQIHAKRPVHELHQSGSLRDRWRQLNDEFKRLYQQRAHSPEATPPRGQATPTQGQPQVRKVNRFKDIDRRFSNIRRAVGNMSARLHNNSTSGQAGEPEMTSSEPRVVQVRDARIMDSEIGEGFLSESPQAERHLYSNAGALNCTAQPIVRQNSKNLPHSSLAVPPTEPLSWYLDSQPTVNKHERPSTGFDASRLGRGDTVPWMKETEHTLVLPPGECRCKTACQHCSQSVTSSDDDDVVCDVTRSRDFYVEDRQLSGMVILTI